MRDKVETIIKCTVTFILFVMFGVLSIFKAKDEVKATTNNAYKLHSCDAYYGTFDVKDIEIVDNAVIYSGDGFIITIAGNQAIVERDDKVEVLPCPYMEKG